MQNIIISVPKLVGFPLLSYKKKAAIRKSPVMERNYGKLDQKEKNSFRFQFRKLLEDKLN